MSDPTTRASLDDEAIRTRAYELWEAEGGVHGLDREHWFKAVQQLSSQAGMQMPYADPKGAPIVPGLGRASDVIADGLQSLSTIAVGTIQAAAALFGLNTGSNAHESDVATRHADAERIDKR